jgi:hypothetical protein
MPSTGEGDFLPSCGTCGTFLDKFLNCPKCEGERIGEKRYLSNKIKNELLLKKQSQRIEEHKHCFHQIAINQYPPQKVFKCCTCGDIKYEDIEEPKIDPITFESDLSKHGPYISNIISKY